MARPCNSAYSINVGDGNERLLRVVPRAPLPSCTAGGSISGVLDLTGSAGTVTGTGKGMGESPSPGTLRCEQVYMTLETEEVVSTSASTSTGGGGGGGTGTGNGKAAGVAAGDRQHQRHSLEVAEAAGDVVVLRKVWAETTEYVGHTAQSHFLLTAPMVRTVHCVHCFHSQLNAHSRSTRRGAT